MVDDHRSVGLTSDSRAEVQGNGDTIATISRLIAGGGEFLLIVAVICSCNLFRPTRGEICIDGTGGFCVHAISMRIVVSRQACAVRAAETTFSLLSFHGAHRSSTGALSLTFFFLLLLFEWKIVSLWICLNLREPIAVKPFNDQLTASRRADKRIFNEFVGET